MDFKENVILGLAVVLAVIVPTVLVHKFYYTNGWFDAGAVVLYSYLFMILCVPALYQIGKRLRSK